jgi:peptidoglycan/xylan/chitin deacetylase (PgdA/CDA1 family)
MYFIKTPAFIQKLFPNALWRIDTAEKKLYLTFDDGPTPEVTEWVLEQLKGYNAKATFFVLGKNMQRYPEIFQQIISAEHSIGNHSFSHLNGWETKDEIYFDDVEKGEAQIQNSKLKIQNVNHKSEIINPKSLFRPPYGRITFSQYNFLKTKYEMVMWEVISGDFDFKLNGEQCFQNVKRNVTNGSIVVFHDSHKGFERLKTCLPKVLEYYSEQGYTFVAL